MLASLAIILCLASTICGQSNIAVQPLTNASNASSNYFNDPFYISSYQSNDTLYFSGTTKAYLECQKPIVPMGCSVTPISTSLSSDIQDQISQAHLNLCSAVNVHPFLYNGSWEAIVGLHVYSGVSLQQPCIEARIPVYGLLRICPSGGKRCFSHNYSSSPFCPCPDTN